MFHSISAFVVFDRTDEVGGFSAIQEWTEGRLSDIHAQALSGRSTRFVQSVPLKRAVEQEVLVQAVRFTQSES